MSTHNHTAISTGAAANASTINTPLGTLDAAIGNLTTLTTTAKTSAVAALNEVDANADAANAAVGTLASLTTTAKSSAVAAINEVDANADAANAAVGTLASLTTTAKNTVVAAINEVDANADAANAAVGSLASLTTTAKNTVVAAINELDAETGGYDSRITTLESEIDAINTSLTGAGVVGVAETTLAAATVIGLSTPAENFTAGQYISYTRTDGSLGKNQIVTIDAGADELTVADAVGGGGITAGALVTSISPAEYFAAGGYNSFADRLDGIDPLPGAMRLAAEADATDVSITLRTAPQGLAARLGWLIINPFTTNCEIRQIVSVSGATVTISTGSDSLALANTHVLDTPVLWTASPLWDVTLFGAVPDGTTDSIAAIRAAYADATITGTGRGALYFPPAPLAYRTGKDIVIDAPQVAVRIEHGARIKPLSGYAPDNIMVDTLWGGDGTFQSCGIFWLTEDAQHVTIDWRGVLDGNVTQVTTRVNGIFMLEAGSINVVGPGELLEMRNGIFAVDCDAVHVSNLSVHPDNTRLSAVVVFEGCENSSIRNITQLYGANIISPYQNEVIDLNNRNSRILVDGIFAVNVAQCIDLNEGRDITVRNVVATDSLKAMSIYGSTPRYSAKAEVANERFVGIFVENVVARYTGAWATAGAIPFDLYQVQSPEALDFWFCSFDFQVEIEDGATALTNAVYHAFANKVTFAHCAISVRVYSPTTTVVFTDDVVKMHTIQRCQLNIMVFAAWASGFAGLSIQAGNNNVAHRLNIQQPAGSTTTSRTGAAIAGMTTRGLRILSHFIDVVATTFDSDLPAYLDNQIISPATAGVAGVRVIPVASSTAANHMQVDAFNGGTGGGAALLLGRNNNGTTPAPGTLAMGEDTSGNVQYYYPDSSGKLRHLTSRPISTNVASGTVVGDQTSHAAFKELLGAPVDGATALALLAEAAEHVQRFRYRDGSYNGEEFSGLVLDGPALLRYGMDADAEHPAGKSLNVVTLLGDVLLALREVRDRLDA